MTQTKHPALALAFCAGLAASTAAFADSTYKLSAGDSLSYSVLYFPELTRNIQIGVDGQVFLPMIGTLDVQGLGLDEVRDLVSIKLLQQPVRLPDPGGSEMRRTLQSEEVVIDVAEYRPVYVTGAVSEPGEVSFRPGLTVRQAIVRAGGIGISTDDLDELRVLDLRTRRDDIASQIVARRDRVTRLQSDLAQLLSGKSNAEVATAENLSAGSAGVEGATEAWLDARVAQRDGERAQLEATLLQMVERLDVLKDLQVVSDETVELREAELARATDLRERGIGTEDLVSDAREDVLQASSRSLSTSNELLRVKALITETENLLTTTEIDARVDLIEAIEQELFELVRLENLLGTLDRNLRLVGQTSESNSGSYSVRNFREGGGAAPVLVEPNEVLLPGDVIEILLEEAVQVEGQSGDL